MLNWKVRKEQKNESLNTMAEPTPTMNSKIRIDFKKYQCNFNKNNTCFTMVLRALLRTPPPLPHLYIKWN